MRAVNSRQTGFRSIVAAVMLLTGTPLASAADPVEVSVKAKQGFKFEPSSLEVPAGAEVVVSFENAGAMAHNVQFPEFEAGTENIGSGKNETITFTAGESGTYEFLCDVPGHAQAGMKGELKVR